MDMVRKLIDAIEEKARLIENPGIPWLRSRASKYSIQNDFGVPLFHSKVCARMPDATIEDVNSAPVEVKRSVEEELRMVMEYVSNREFIAIDAGIGHSTGFRLTVRTFISAKYPHLALMFATNYFDPPDDSSPVIYSIDIPEWPRKLVIVDPLERATVILGSDYYGELKMSALRMAMNYARDWMGLLGVHAGTKVYNVEGSPKGGSGFLVFGLSGTGKSTITFHLHEDDLRPGESVAIRQDDINMLTRTAYAYATERNFYPKTDSAPSIPNLYKALHHPDTILENVALDNGRLDFLYTSGCHSNARAIAIRHAIEGSDNRYDTPRITTILFLTRRNDMPVAARTISPEQAAAYFMLGESIKTSAGTMDPSEVGKPVRVPGFDPFIIGPKWVNGLRFYEVLKLNPGIRVYIMNTGYVGGVKVRPEHTLKTILAIARGEAEEEFDDNLNMYVVKKAPGVDLSGLNPAKLVPEYGKHIRGVREERRKYLHTRFPEVGFMADAI